MGFLHRSWGIREQTLKVAGTVDHCFISKPRRAASWTRRRDSDLEMTPPKESRGPGSYLVIRGYAKLKNL